MGGYTGTESGEIHAPDYLFAPGSYTIAAYSAHENITISGTTATVAPDSKVRVGQKEEFQGLRRRENRSVLSYMRIFDSSVTQKLPFSATLISNAPGWLMTSVQEVTIEADTDHELTAAMHHQVRQLTLVIEPTGDAADRIESIEGCLSGAAGTLDFATGTYGAASDVALHFTRITEGSDAGKWTATVRLLGIVGDTQRLTATLTTDSKGNAYLYGSWNANAKLTVSANYLTSKIEKTLSASVPAQSYALDTPQTITKEKLKEWCGSATDITGYYRLEADIDLSDDGNWTPIGNATTNRVQGRFIGTFDGDGHTITGLTSNSGGDFGLFRTIGEGGVVKNMNISCNISGNGGFKGGIAANNYGTIENCHVSGTISGSNRIGGIAGYNTYTTTSGAQIIACSNTASINGTDDVGGICGDNNKSTVLACYNIGEIKKDSENGGAICGYNRGTATSCYYTKGTGVGTQVTEWNDAIDDMNSALQAAGYSYQYELDTSSGLPMIG